MISISSLIYRSPIFADWVYNSLYEFTPKLHNGEAEFYFIANDPTEELVFHLKQKNYPFYINYNPKRKEEELFRMGFGPPEYIHRVYRGWNFAIEASKGDIVVLVNSDNYFSPNWLENLLENLTENRIVTSQLVEPNTLNLFPGAYYADFGKTPEKFDKERFINFANSVSKVGIEEGGAYMPCMCYKNKIVEAGYYPEGNLAGNSYSIRDIRFFGDQFLFHRLKNIGVSHFTVKNSIVYHLKEGEMKYNEK